MKKITLAITLTLLIVISLSLFTQAQAAWYDWLGWSKIKSVFIKEKVEDKKETPVETQNQDESNSDTTKITPEEPKPDTNTKNSNVENTEVESLKAEVAALKANLDNLYKAHNGLVEDHNKLLKYTNDEISDLTNRYNNLVNIVSKPSVPQITDTSNLERKVSNLENTTENICKSVFSGIGIGSKCPSGFIIVRNTLEGRIENLERLIK